MIVSDSPYDWSFRTDSVDIAVESWSRMLSDNHLSWSVDELFWPTESFEAGVRRRALGDLTLVDCVCDPSTGSRGTREMATADDEYFVLLMALDGEEVVEQGADSSLLTPGTAVFWDSTEPASFRVNQRLTKRSLLVPKAALADYGARGRLGSGKRLRVDQPAVRLLASHLDIVAETIDDMPLNSIATVRNATMELLCAAVMGDAAHNARSPEAMVMQAQRFIEEHLRHPRLGPAMVADNIGVSVRTLHRIFSESGSGVAELIRIRRLASARDDILAGTPVTTAARRWRYADASHFTRSFKQHYGMTPTELLAGEAAA